MQPTLRLATTSFVMILNGAQLSCMTTCEMEPPWPTACRLRLLSLTCFNCDISIWSARFCSAPHGYSRGGKAFGIVSLSRAGFLQGTRTLTGPEQIIASTLDGVDDFQQTCWEMFGVIHTQIKLASDQRAKLIMQAIIGMVRTCC